MPGIKNGKPFLIPAISDLCLRASCSLAHPHLPTLCSCPRVLCTSGLPYNMPVSILEESSLFFVPLGTTESTPGVLGIPVPILSAPPPNPVQGLPNPYVGLPGPQEGPTQEQ